MFSDNLYLMGPTTTTTSSSSCCSWSRDEDKLFEEALVIFPEDTPNRWHKIASQVPGKTPLEVETHYQILVDDVNAIEAGLVELPSYTDELLDQDSSFERRKTRGGETERRKGTPWTEEEHKLFLIGLSKYGKGDWRSISRMAVVSRTPTQVASHAQKYFNRINSDKKEKKRSSIHDITVDDASVCQAASQNSVAALSNPSHQAMDTLSMVSQVSFPNHGGASRYQSYGYHM